jgi:hypothetical protein
VKCAARDGVNGLLLTAMLVLGACSDRQESDATAVVPQPVAQAPVSTDAPTVEYSSEPASHQSGDNTISVQIRDKDGSPMTDLSVSVTYYMPAMPTMNMPEMRDSFTLSQKGEGKYTGTVRLSMGGAWAVTVLARRGEETVARKQLNIFARQ